MIGLYYHVKKPIDFNFYRHLNPKNFDDKKLYQIN